MSDTVRRTRTGETPENNWVEATSAELNASLEVNINAKGMYQYSVKFFFRGADELLAHAVHQAVEFDKQFRSAFPTPSAGDK
jgi:hypothetical protein